MGEADAWSQRASQSGAGARGPRTRVRVRPATGKKRHAKSIAHVLRDRADDRRSRDFRAGAGFRRSNKNSTLANILSSWIRHRTHARVGEVDAPCLRRLSIAWRGPAVDNRYLTHPAGLFNCTTKPYTTCSTRCTKRVRFPTKHSATILRGNADASRSPCAGRLASALSLSSCLLDGRCCPGRCQAIRPSPWTGCYAHSP